MPQVVEPKADLRGLLRGLPGLLEAADRAGGVDIEDDRLEVIAAGPVHRAAYNHYRGVPVHPPDIDGDDVQFDEASTREAQLTRISARIVDLVARQAVAAGDIVVLIADAPHKVDYYSMLKRQPLPKPAAWAEEGPRGRNSVLIDTVQRFKGLEAPIVILWGLDPINTERSQELLYVGMSRAKSLLVLVATPETCAAIRASG